MSKIEEYKKQIKDCLMNKNNFSEEEADNLIKIYEEDFEEFLEKDLSPAGAVAAMFLGY